MSFGAGILARARKHLGKLRLTFGLGPSAGAPAVIPRPACIALSSSPATLVDLRAEPTAAVALSSSPATLVTLTIEAC